MKQHEKSENNFPANVVLFLVIFTSVVCSLKRIEEWYQQAVKDDDFCSTHRTCDFSTFTQNIPASLQLQLVLFVLLLLYGFMLKNATILVFSVVNALAIVAGVAVTHAEFSEYMRTY